MDQTPSETPLMEQIPIDCACVIHGDLYGWEYVERLYAMLCKNFSVPVRMHVFTEAYRPVPLPMIKHTLKDWPGVAGRKKAWWYKMQMFSPKQFSGRMLYFDLDVVITGSLDSLLSLRPDYFWTIRDFKYLWKPYWRGINSSVMFWNVSEFGHIWKTFKAQNITEIMRQYPGDQDFLTSIIDPGRLKFIDENWVKSWRWQVLDGGMDFKRRRYLSPGSGSNIDPATKIVVFHGNPKPHELNDANIIRYWV